MMKEGEILKKILSFPESVPVPQISFIQNFLLLCNFFSLSIANEIKMY